LCKNQIEIVVTDLMMPTMDRPAFIEALGKIDPRLKIIAVSGLASKSKLGEVDRLNLQGFLSKPYGTDKLLNALRDVLRSK
jgi:two-component system cell cycle sensor histidine kinase/response regulator CckA